MIDIDHEQGIGKRSHALDAAKASLELFLLTIQTKDFFLGQGLKTALFGHLLQIGQSFHRLADGFVVGEHPAKPAMTDERHFAAFSLCADGISCRAFGADKQHPAAIGNNGLDEGVRVARHRQAFFEIDDVDFVTFTEDEGCHLRVPVTGLMTKMHASLKHLAHGNVCHEYISGLGLRTPHLATPFSVGHPA